MNYGNGDARMVKLAELWERTSARGARYFSGFMGGTQVLMFDGGEKPHPTKPGETVHVWWLMVQERDSTRRPQARDTGGPANRSASPVARGEGWKGSQYRRPANGAVRAPTADDGTVPDETLEDLYR